MRPTRADGHDRVDVAMPAPSGPRRPVRVPSSEESGAPGVEPAQVEDSPIGTGAGSGWPTHPRGWRRPPPPVRGSSRRRPHLSWPRVVVSNRCLWRRLGKRRQWARSATVTNQEDEHCDRRDRRDPKHDAPARLQSREHQQGNENREHGPESRPVEPDHQPPQSVLREPGRGDCSHKRADRNG
jgi:hypothetical protein